MTKKRKARPKFIGWVGIVDGKPFFERASDSYSTRDIPETKIADVFKSQSEAKRRFQAIARVYMEVR